MSRRRSSLFHHFRISQRKRHSVDPMPSNASITSKKSSLSSIEERLTESHDRSSTPAIFQNQTAIRFMVELQQLPYHIVLHILSFLYYPINDYLYRFLDIPSDPHAEGIYGEEEEHHVPAGERTMVSELFGKLDARSRESSMGPLLLYRNWDLSSPCICGVSHIPIIFTDALFALLFEATSDGQEKANTAIEKKKEKKKSKQQGKQKKRTREKKHSERQQALVSLRRLSWRHSKGSRWGQALKSLTAQGSDSWLSDTETTIIPIPFMADLRSQLLSLDLSFHKLTDDIVHTELTHFSSLTSLTLRHNCIGDAGAIVIFKHPAFSKLTYLDLSECGLTDLALETCFHSRQLRTLILNGNQITDEGALHLASCEKLCLSRLVLNDCNLTDRSLKPIFLNFKTLRRLELNGNCFTSNGLQHIVFASPRLHLLSMDQCCIDAHSALEIAKSKRITSLHLRGNDIGNVGLAHILNNNHTLIELDVAKNGITDHGLALDVTHDLSLRRLNLAFNSLTARGLREFSKRCSIAGVNLHTLDISFNGVAPNEVVSLIGELHVPFLRCDDVIKDFPRR